MTQSPAAPTVEIDLAREFPSRAYAEAYVARLGVANLPGWPAILPVAGAVVLAFCRADGSILGYEA